MDNNSDLSFVKLINSENGNVEAFMCKGCKKIYKNVNQRILQNHRNSCQKRVPEDDAESVINSSACMIEDDCSLQNTRPRWSKNQIDILLIKMFTACNIPFRAVENIHFKKFVEALQYCETSYTLPCRQTLGSSFLNRLHEDIVEERKRLLNNTPSVLLIDGWKNKSNNKKLLVFSIRNVNTTNTFLSYVDFSMETEDGETLASAIDEAILYAKEIYNTDVYAVVTDNDSKIVCGVRLATTCNNSNVWQSTCSSHSGNLLLKNLVVSSFADTVRGVVNAFREPKIEAWLLKEGGTKLQNYPDTRFCFFRDSCKSIYDNFELLKQIVESGDVHIANNISETLNINFKNQLDETIKQLDPICSLINDCQNPNKNIADAAEMWVSLQLSKKYDSQLITSRMNKAVWPIAYAANMIHPKYEGMSLNEDQQKKGFDFFEDNCDRETLQELDSFLNDRKEPVKVLQSKCKNPIGFWKLCNAFYPHLSEFAVKLFLIPASTAELESLFSHWSFVHNMHRNRLLNDKSAKVLDIYYSLRRFQLNSFRDDYNNFNEDDDDNVI